MAQRFPGEIWLFFRCRTKFQDEFVQLGGLLKYEEEVLNIEDGSPAIVVTKNGTYTADKVVVTVGSWIAKLIPNLPITVKVGLTHPWRKWCSFLQPQSIHVTYFKAKRAEDEQLTEMGAFPVFISSAIGSHPDVFGLPAVDYPHLIKVWP